MEESNKMSLDKVMRKLQKLKKLYEGAKKINSEGEANNAAALMQKLLLEYNLTMEDVGSDEERVANPMLHESISGFTYKSIGGIWEQRLTHVLCKHNFCKCYVYGSSYKRLIIIGEKENIETVKWMLNLLKEGFVEFSKSRYKEYLKDFEPSWDSPKPMGKDKFQRSYLVGCAVGLDDKLTAEKKKAEEELGSRVTALVVRKDTEITEYVNKTWGGVSRGRTQRENYDVARSTGIKDGRSVEINKQLSGGTKKAAGYLG